MRYGDDKYLTDYFEEELENFAQDVVSDSISQSMSYAEDDFEFLDELESDDIMSEDFPSVLPEEDIYVEDEYEDEDEDAYDPSLFEEETFEYDSDIAMHKDDGMHLPGAENMAIDEEVEEVVAETTWENDRDTSKFIDYLRSSWENIPKHDGTSISGCERAYNYLNRLSKEISEAIRKDEGSLDQFIGEIEEYRRNIIKGMQALSDRQRQLKQELMGKKAQVEQSALNKQATYPSLQVVITPFERAITGILINSVISAGHPFEDVYSYLKEKFDLTPREELSILQTVVDMGFPIFKDRGLMGGDETDGTKEGHHLDFIKNYFA
jgi:hypothetical protein